MQKLIQKYVNRTCLRICVISALLNLLNKYNVPVLPMSGQYTTGVISPFTLYSSRWRQMLVASTERVQCVWKQVIQNALVCTKNVRLFSSKPFIPVSQLVPVYPARQAQEKALSRFSHTPPLAQGSLSHSSRSTFRIDIQAIWTDYTNHWSRWH